MLIIDVVGLGCISATWALAGGGSGGLGPYLQAVGTAATSPWSLLKYCLLIAGYSAGLEFVLRRVIQRPISRLGRIGAHLAAPVAALAYGLTHAIYHPAGIVYALVLGSSTAAVFVWLKDWRPLALWHVQWNALAIGGTLLLALWGPGDAQTAVLVAYKTEQIEKGNLIWLDRWGWVDRNHYADNQMERALTWAAGGGPDALVLKVKLTTIIGTQHPFTRTYERGLNPRGPIEDWAMACGAVLDFNHAHERAQATAPWWTGSHASAFQFDDLPSVLLACLDAHPDATQALPPRSSPSPTTQKRWKQEGSVLVTTAEDAWVIPSTAKNRAQLKARLDQVVGTATRSAQLSLSPR